MSSKSKKKKGEVSSNESSKRTFSRNALYAPLQAYDEEPSSSHYTSPSNHTIPRSCTEAAFVDWIHQLSVDYHQSCQPGDPRNTGNRFVSTGEVKEKIMYRTLSLFGKEYGAKLGGTAAGSGSTTKPVGGTTKKNIKRDRKRKRQSKCLTVVDNADQVKLSMEFLTKLHTMWTQYILKLVKAKGCGPFSDETNDTTAMSKVSRIIMECANTIEWVGARVRIVECKACANWEGRQGVLVASTKNTWIVYEICNDSNTRLVQLTIPKRGSSVAIIFRVQQNQDKATTTPFPWRAEIDSSTLQIHLRGNI